MKSAELYGVWLAEYLAGYCSTTEMEQFNFITLYPRYNFSIYVEKDGYIFARDDPFVQCVCAALGTVRLWPVIRGS